MERDGTHQKLSSNRSFPETSLSLSNTTINTNSPLWLPRLIHFHIETESKFLREKAWSCSLADDDGGWSSSDQQAGDFPRLCLRFSQRIGHVRYHFHDQPQGSRRFRCHFGEESLLVLRSLHAQPHEEHSWQLRGAIQARFGKLRHFRHLFCFYTIPLV